VAAQVSEREKLLDLFCSALERGFSITASAARLGRSASWGSLAMKEICDRLGPQATELDLGWRP
jgi:hypothetical protein